MQTSLQTSNAVVKGPFMLSKAAEPHVEHRTLAHRTVIDVRLENMLPQSSPLEITAIFRPYPCSARSCNLRTAPSDAEAA